MVVDIIHTMTHSHLMCLYEYENTIKSEKNACFFCTEKILNVLWSMTLLVNI